MAWNAAIAIGHAILGLLAYMQQLCKASVTCYLHVVRVDVCMTCGHSWFVSTGTRLGMLAIHVTA